MNAKNNSAIALILSVGIIAVLTMITVGFSAFTRLELMATENQVNSYKAQLIAEAGIARAIEDIKYNAQGAMNDPYDSPADPWYYPGNGNSDGPGVSLKDASAPSYGGNISYGGGYYRLKVIDCGALVNINCPLPNADARNDLENILEELGLSSSQANDLVSFRLTLPDNVFTTKEEVKLVSGIDQDKYDEIKDFITLWGDNDDGITNINKSISSPAAGHLQKSFVNINTAPKEVLFAVLRPMMNSDSQADDLADAIKARRQSDPFDGLNSTSFMDARGEFEHFLDYAESVNIISATNRDLVKSQSDPNSYSFDPINLTYPNSTDSTNIGFDANGYYEIECQGNYRGARKTVKKVVSVFRKINQTTKDEFADNSSFATNRVTWKDFCPVDFTLLKNFSYSDDSFDNQNAGDYIYSSLKLGFWDNFEEDYDPSNPNPNASGMLGPWREVQETFTINDGGNGILETLIAGAITYGTDYHPIVRLESNVCIVDDFSLILHGIDETSDSKYPGFRPDLPWPAVPAEWWFWAPAPDASNCPDIGTYLEDPDGNRIQDASGNDILIDVQYVLDHTKSSFIHQQYLNTLHVKFGGVQASTGNVWMSSIFCNNIQNKDLWKNTTPVYQNWVNYDGSGYIYFTPSPPLGPGWEEWFQTCMKSHDVIKTGNVMVTCNQWYWGGHPADLGTEYFPIPGGAYHNDKTFHLKGLGRWKTRGEVYFSTVPAVGFDTNEQVMVYEDRYFEIAGLGNLPDVDYVRILPEQGVYTSNLFSPAAGMGSGQHLEWGTITAHITFPETVIPATPAREPVFLTVSDSAIVIPPDPGDIPINYFLPSGGAIGNTSSQSLAYQAYLFSDFGEADINNIDFEQAPVVEDVTITYLPKTEIVYDNMY